MLLVELTGYDPAISTVKASWLLHFRLQLYILVGGDGVAPPEVIKTTRFTVLSASIYGLTSLVLVADGVLATPTICV